ncbi:MAG: RNA polymerase subunit sigma-70 [Rhodothermaceae bacterium]|nr:RNA polymerase subunit sigma-70 [Rhodothermaceae bacterium]
MLAEPTTTQLLHDARGGNRAALDRLFPRLYDELRVLAHARLRRHRPGETLNTTAVVHEAFLKLTAGETPSVESRTHFFALASRAMRFVLISYARERTAQKRGGPQADLPLDEALAIAASGGAEAEALDLLHLDAALDRLAAVSERLAEVVEYRFFGGMAHEEIARATGRSVPTVKRDWRRARTYLFRFMRESTSGSDDPPEGDAAIEA